MPLVLKSADGTWRIWTGPWRVGGKTVKKKLGFVVAVNIREDKLPVGKEPAQIRQDIIDLLKGYVSRFG